MASVTIERNQTVVDQPVLRKDQKLVVEALENSDSVGATVRKLLTIWDQLSRPMQIRIVSGAFHETSPIFLAIKEKVKTLSAEDQREVYRQFTAPESGEDTRTDEQVSDEFAQLILKYRPKQK